MTGTPIHMKTLTTAMSRTRRAEPAPRPIALPMPGTLRAGCSLCAAVAGGADEERPGGQVQLRQIPRRQAAAPPALQASDEVDERPLQGAEPLGVLARIGGEEI